MSTPTEAPHTPNHHAHHQGFAGLRGALLGAVLAVGRGADARLAVHLAEVAPADHVVDIGCGPGNAVRAAGRVGARATGVDPARVMRRIARALTRSADRLRYLNGTAEALPLPDRSATAAWSLATVHHWADLDAGLREVRRVLAPGGRFVVIERHTTAGATGLASHGWTDQQAERFADLCRAHGFTHVRVERPTFRGRRRGIAVLARTP